MDDSIKSNADFWLTNKVLLTEKQINKPGEKTETDPSIHMNVTLNKTGILKEKERAIQVCEYSDN